MSQDLLECHFGYCWCRWLHQPSGHPTRYWFPVREMMIYVIVRITWSLFPNVVVAITMGPHLVEVKEKEQWCHVGAYAPIYKWFPVYHVLSFKQWNNTPIFIGERQQNIEVYTYVSLSYNKHFLNHTTLFLNVQLFCYMYRYFFLLYYAYICYYKHQAWKGGSQCNEKLEKLKYSINLLRETK
jgi:hypothetical protein